MIVPRFLAAPLDDSFRQAVEGPAMCRIGVLGRTLRSMATGRLGSRVDAEILVQLRIWRGFRLDETPFVLLDPLSDRWIESAESPESSHSRSRGVPECALDPVVVPFDAFPATHTEIDQRFANRTPLESS